MEFSRFVVLGLTAAALIAGCSKKEPEQAADAQSADTAATGDAASTGYPTRVFYGDTHLHTAMSMDAGLFGNRLGVEAAYRFARGEEVDASNGQKAKLRARSISWWSPTTPTTWDSPPTCSLGNRSFSPIPPARDGTT